jgi:uncharacterized protein (TIGR02246 family)
MRFVALVLTLGIPAAHAAQSAESAVGAVLAEQVRAWNNGDLPAFVRTYSAETVFVGKEITRGSAGVLDRYRRNYPTRERMGRLNFSDVEIRMLGRDFASVLGRFHLDRSPDAGGAAQGIFTLLVKRSGKRWTIILDHTH